MMRGDTQLVAVAVKCLIFGLLFLLDTETARFAHREWLPCIMLGWYGSDWYWKYLFAVDGPPKPSDADFDGFPITIHGVRL